MLCCAYCPYPFLNGKKIRLKDPRLVVDEIEELLNIGMKNFRFADSVFNLPEKHAEEICHEIIRRKLDVRWKAYAHLQNLTKDFLSLIVKAGCVGIDLSLDGYSDEILQILDKNMKRDEIDKSVRLVRDFPELKTVYCFFLNPPGQTFLGWIKMIRFYLYAKIILGRRCSFKWFEITILPHTKVHDMALKEGAILPLTSLLPKTVKSLKSIIYTNNSTKYLECVNYVICFLQNGKNILLNRLTKS